MNLVKCDRCKKVTIDEDYNHHLCTVNPKGEKIINADYILVIENIDCKTIEVKGLDGIIYKIRQIPEDKEHTKIPYVPSLDTNKMSNTFDSTHKIKSYILGYFIVR